jgi:hypothetical protein
MRVQLTALVIAGAGDGVPPSEIDSHLSNETGVFRISCVTCVYA